MANLGKPFVVRLPGLSTWVQGDFLARPAVIMENMPMKTKRPLIVILLILLAFFCIAPQAALSWNATGSLHDGRIDHTATLLKDGKVLVAGGSGYPPLRSCEIFDPATGQWTYKANLLGWGRYSHTATLLNNGWVLVAGGIDSWNSPIYIAEIYKPETGGFVRTGDMKVSRAGHKAELLDDGRVLVAGGAGNYNSCEIFDPASGTWALTGSQHSNRAQFAVTLLSNGKVLTAGGVNWSVSPYYSKSCEIFTPNANPANGTWANTGDLNVARYMFPVALMPDGIVLAAGGSNMTGWLNTAEYFDPLENSGEGAWISTGSLTQARMRHTATCLKNGRVLVAGGQGQATTGEAIPLTSAELFNPASESWDAAPPLTTARMDHTATLLADGKVLVAGGDDGNGIPLQSAEIYNPSYVWCPAGPPVYFAGTGHWYRAFTFSPTEFELRYNNWEYAKSQAEVMGGYLATVTSAEENDFIFNLIKQDRLWFQTDPASNYAQGPWIGGRQDYRLTATLNPAAGSDDQSRYYVWKTDGGHVYANDAWKWVNGETWSYTNWANGEPNDYPNYEASPYYERGHQNYLHYFNNQYNPADPSSTRWAPTWEDATLDGYNYVRGFVVEWDQQPPPLPIGGNIATLNLLLLD